MMRCSRDDGLGDELGIVTEDDAGDREILDRSCRVNAVVGLGGQRHFTDRVPFDTHRGHLRMYPLMFLLLRSSPNFRQMRKIAGTGKFLIVSRTRGFRPPDG